MTPAQKNAALDQVLDDLSRGNIDNHTAAQRLEDIGVHHSAIDVLISDIEEE